MQQRFLLQILLLAQHVSGTTMPIIRSSRVLYSGCRLWCFALWFSICWSSVELRVMCPVCRMLQHPANRTHNPSSTPDQYHHKQGPTTTQRKEAQSVAPHTSHTAEGALLSFRHRLAGNSDPVQSNGTLEPRWYQVPVNLIRHTNPTLAHLQRFNVKHTIHGTRTVTSSQTDPLTPVTYGNLLFKLHPFLSKLCQARNFPYIILYCI